MSPACSMICSVFHDPNLHHHHQQRQTVPRSSIFRMFTPRKMNLTWNRRNQRGTGMRVTRMTRGKGKVGIGCGHRDSLLQRDASPTCMRNTSQTTTAIRLGEFEEGSFLYTLPLFGRGALFPRVILMGDGDFPRFCLRGLSAKSEYRHLFVPSLDVSFSFLQADIDSEERRPLGCHPLPGLKAKTEPSPPQPSRPPHIPPHHSRRLPRLSTLPCKSTLIVTYSFVRPT